MKFLIFYGSYRRERMGLKVAKLVTDTIKEKGHDAELIDAKEYDFGILDRMYKEYDGDSPEKMKELSEKISGSDGFILVSGEYNHSIQPGLSNLLDHFQSEYLKKPSSIVAYSPGNIGGARAAMQVRALMPELGSVSLPTIFYFPEVHNFEEKVKDERIQKGLHGLIDEMFWYADALKTKRESEE